MVAIAVLVVGIAIIIEMYPPGFAAMDAAAARVRAQAMASNEFNRTNSQLSQIALIYAQYNPDVMADQPTWASYQTWNTNIATQYAKSGINGELVVSGE